MATYEEILKEAASKWMDAATVLAKAKALKVNTSWLEKAISWMASWAWQWQNKDGTSGDTMRQMSQLPVTTRPPVQTDPFSKWLWAWYWTKANASQSNQIIAWQITKIWHSAPNGKYYDLTVWNDWQTSFIGSDNMMKTFATQKEAQDYIDSKNKQWSQISYWDAQAQLAAKDPTKYVWWSSESSKMTLPEDTSGWTEKDFEDFDWRKKVDELNQSMSKSFNNLSSDTSAFKETVWKNMAAEMAKNKQLQEELNNYKQKVDADLAVVRTKFDENTNKQLDRINQLEETYMKNLNEQRNLQWDYYKTQQDELNNRVGGEQAWLQWTLSARGIDQWVINSAIEKARTAHLWQFNELQNQNINVLGQLNDAYKTFANDINGQRWKLEDADLALIKDKMATYKTMYDTWTWYNKSMIDNTFKPYTDAIAAQTSAQINEMWYEASDKAVAERFDNSEPADRVQMLQEKFQQLTDWTTWVKLPLSKIDIQLLTKAATFPTYWEAIQYLANAGKTVAASSAWSSSAIAKYATWKATPAKTTSPTWWKTESTRPAWSPESLPWWVAASDWTVSTPEGWDSWVKWWSVLPAAKKIAAVIWDSALNLLIKNKINPVAWFNSAKWTVQDLAKSWPQIKQAYWLLKAAWMNAEWLKNIIWAWLQWAAKYANPEYIAMDVVDYMDNPNNPWVQTINKVANRNPFNKDSSLSPEVKAKVDKIKQQLNTYTSTSQPWYQTLMNELTRLRNGGK